MGNTKGTVVQYQERLAFFYAANPLKLGDLALAELGVGRAILDESGVSMYGRIVC